MIPISRKTKLTHIMEPSTLWEVYRDIYFSALEEKTILSLSVNFVVVFIIFQDNALSWFIYKVRKDVIAKVNSSFPYQRIAEGFEPVRGFEYFPDLFCNCRHLIRITLGQFLEYPVNVPSHFQSIHLLQTVSFLEVFDGSNSHNWFLLNFLQFPDVLWSNLGL